MTQFSENIKFHIQICLMQTIAKTIEVVVTSSELDKANWNCSNHTNKQRRQNVPGTAGWHIYLLYLAHSGSLHGPPSSTWHISNRAPKIRFISKNSNVRKRKNHSVVSFLVKNTHFIHTSIVIYLLFFETNYL